MKDFQEHLTRQIAFSRATFGPGKRTKGVIEHLRKELIELEESDGSADEWADVAILALDGLLRSYAFLNSDDPQTSQWAAEMAVGAIVHKQSKNELRIWPDWRLSSEDDPIEHQRGVHD